MQSINENTYIDDSLITCAEYQLFIDEMRDLGVYYAPLHWSSDQFPEGRAREPVLGVRQSDALAFSEWMTRREGGEWKYRLPTREEIIKFPLKPAKQSLLGYWLHEAHYFAWVGLVPGDARGIAHSLGPHLRSEFATYSEKALERDIIRARSENFPLEVEYTYEENAEARSNADVGDDGKALEQAQRNADSRAYALRHSLTRTLARAHVLDLDLAFARAPGLGLNIAFINVEAVNHAAVLARDISRARELVFDYAYTPDEMFDNALDVFIDLYTLQERLAHRSPAFEGIRIVKEREK